MHNGSKNGSEPVPFFKSLVPWISVLVTSWMDRGNSGVLRVHERQNRRFLPQCPSTRAQSARNRLLADLEPEEYIRMMADTRPLRIRGVDGFGTTVCHCAGSLPQV